MAEQTKKTQAQKAAAGKKSSGTRTSGKKNASDSNGGRSNKQLELQERFQLPPRFLSAAIGLTLFIVFLTMFLQPEGALVNVLQSVVKGLVGGIAFYIAIPALLYFFIIQAFSADRPVRMRSWSLLGFVLLCGCLSQLLGPSGQLRSGFAVIADLYTGGADGSTAGVICGGVALLLKLLIGEPLSVVLLFAAALFALLGAMQITVPSIIRAVQNRPRADWETKPEEKPEPAAMVVNHLAAKRIAYVEKKRGISKSEPPLDVEAPMKPSRKPAKKNDRPGDPDIDLELEGPVAAAEHYISQQGDDSIFTNIHGQKKAISENIPPEMPQMPALDLMAEETVPAPVPPAPPAPAAAQPAKVSAKEAADSAAQVAQEIEENAQISRPQYCFPPIELLNRPAGNALDGSMEMRDNTRRLNETLASFKIDAHIINVTRGPSVTRYEVELKQGVRLNKLTTVADDIALSLGASGVRIAAVPNKISVVGIEVPNRTVTTVSLREVIDSPEFNRAKSKSTFAVGKDIGGASIVSNIAKLPHMLIAGTTGSGKSVCMNSIIISLLYKAGPEDVKLIMIDPKMVELGIYNSIPHLLIPVVTDPKKAAGSLQWAVTEMMRRYKAMSDVGVRDLESYNAIMDMEEGQKIPQVVVIIDELADLMLVAAKEVEESICRIAQMGRASGIHLIIATQRPSADVITGLMKANIPSRIAFAVASAMESRIILDTQGAEKLVGKGDMLFAPIGCGKPMRVQGCFVSDSEVEAVATYVKDNFRADYDSAVIEEIERKAAQTGKSTGEPEANDTELGGDDMLPAAVEVILETGQASVSMLQRRLKLGYARAARIVDEMEEKGIVGPFQGSKPRSILVTREQWAAMRGAAPAQMRMEDLTEAFDAMQEELDG